MRYYGPAERIVDGKNSGLWHYVMRHRDQVIPVGYCARNCDGHPTQEAACRHYRDYLLDHQLAFFDDPDVMLRCVVCNEMTTGRGHVSTQMWVLCADHRNRSEIEKRYEVGQIWES